MPPVVAWVAVTLSVSLTVAEIIVTIVQLGVSLLISSALTPKPKSQSAVAGPLPFSMISGEPRFFCYGRGATGGVVKYWETLGTNNVDLWFVVAVHDTPCEAFETFISENTTINFTANAATNKYVKGATPYMWRYDKLGLESQTVETNLDTASTIWTSAHRARGVAYYVLKMKHESTVYPLGIPQPLLILKGRRLWDPRLDNSYGGSGSHVLADETTWTWTTNPALCLLDYLKGVNIAGKRIAGCGIPIGQINHLSFAVAANVCDEDVPLLAGGSEDRYTCNGFVNSIEEKEAVVEAMLLAMHGTLCVRGGQVYLIAGAAQTSVMTLTDDDLAGELVINPSNSRQDKINSLTCAFSDPSQNYAAVPGPPLTVAQYVTDDGGVTLSREVAHRFSTSVTTVARLNKLVLSSFREQLSLQGRWKPKALEISAGDTFTWSSDIWGTSTTNLVLYSQDYSNVYWTLFHITLVSTNNADPSGGSTATKIGEDNTNNAHNISNDMAGLPDNTDYTVSIYIKPAERTWCRVQWGDKAAVANRINVNLSGVGSVGLTAGSVTNIVVQALPSGFYRISMKINTASGANTPSIRVSCMTGDNSSSTYTGTTGSGIIIWGAQLELGATLHNYVATTSAPVTRADPLKMICLGRSQLPDGSIDLVARQETDAKYAWATSEEQAAPSFGTGPSAGLPPLLAAPTGLAVSQSGDVVILTWNEVAATYLSGYNIYKASGLGQSFGSATLIESNRRALNFSTAFPAGAYTFFVAGVDVYGRVGTESSGVDFTVTVSAGISGTLLEIITAVGLLGNLTICCDAGDAISYTGSGTSWVDRSGGSNNFTIDAPPFQGTAGGKSANEYFLAETSDVIKLTGTNPLQSFHKDNAKLTIMLVHSPGDPAFDEVLLGDASIVTVNDPGFRLWLEQQSQSEMHFFVRNAGGYALDVNLGGGYRTDGWNFYAVTLDEAVGANGGKGLINGRTPVSFTSTYTSPSSSSAGTTLEIGCSADAAGNPGQMSPGSRVAMLACWTTNVNPTDLAALYAAIRASRTGFLLP